jgi:isocitrate dehydrogenase (NAD+)
MTRTITLIPGDGIGPEVTGATVRVVEAAGVAVEWERHSAGTEAYARHGTPLPQEVLDSILRNGVALKGPIATEVGKGLPSVNVALRKALVLYANLRPVRSLAGVPARFSDVDLVVVRENTEGLYSGIEHEVVPGVMESLKIITAVASTRIARFAYEHARAQGRKRVTTVHKANIMKRTDGLFLDCCRAVGKEYPEVTSDDKIVDNMCMQLVLNPHQYDVLLCENLYGDIVSDLVAGLVGGLGVVPGANIGEKAAVFEAVHGSAPDIAGRNLANPLALIRSAVMMLHHIGETAAAQRIEAAIGRLVSEKGVLTRDLGGSATTTEFTEALVREIGEAA